MGNEFRTPTETTAPVANTTSGLWTFASPASQLLLRNHSGEIIYVRFNSSSAASASAYDLILVNNESLHLQAKDYGVVDFTKVSVWFPTSSTVGNFNIRGI